MPLATLTSQIIQQYLNYYRIIEESGYVSLPKQALKILFNLIDESEFDPIVEAAAKQIMVDIRLHYGNVTDENVASWVQRWYESNGMVLKKLSDNGHTKYVCKHDLGLKWSKLAIRILAELFQSDMIKQDIKDDTFSFELKKKSDHLITCTNCGCLPAECEESESPRNCPNCSLEECCCWNEFHSEKLTKKITA